MADWRNNDNSTPKPKRQPKPAPQPESAVPQLNPPPTGGWKGRGAKRPASGTPAAGPTRSWTGSQELDGTQSLSGLRRWLMVGFWFGLATFLTIVFVAWLWLQPRRLPLVVFSVGDYDSLELRENAYGNQQRERLSEVDRDNVTFFTQPQNGNDNGLGTLRNPDWSENFNGITAKRITPGGPHRNFVVFYVSAYATFDDEDALWIHTQSSAPFATSHAANPSSPPSTSLQLSEVLSNLTQTVKRGGVAWIVLDLQQPPLLANLGELDPPWRTATERAINAMDETLRSRLIVTLPGDDGQRNWLSPEFNASFLGHHFRQLLAGHGAERSLIDNALTLGRFRQKLDESVERDVANRRYAVQRPIWLPEATVEKFAGRKLVMLKDVKPVDQPQPSENVASLMQEIDSLWDNFTSGPYQAAYRWDPLGFAAVESQLLELEQVALYQPEKFSNAKIDVQQALERLLKPTIEFGVSLIEDQSRQVYFANQMQSSSALDETFPERALARQLASRLPTEDPNLLPAFWLPPAKDDKELEQRQAQPRAEEKLTKRQQSHLAWQFIVECAKTNDNRIWGTVFRQDRLQKVIDFGQVGGDVAPVELYLLKRLVEDIDWTQPTPQRWQACAEGVLLFDRLQRVATCPDPEISWWWLRDSEEPVLKAVEQAFLLGVDHCLGGKYSEALVSFNDAKTRLNRIEERQAILRSASQHLAHALHDLPHLLSWQLQEYQFAPAQELPAITQRLGKLTRLANLTHDLHGYLKQRPTYSLDQGIEQTSQRLKELLAELKQSFAVYAQTQSNEQGSAKINPLTFRRSRIALRSPFLSPVARRRLHQNTLPFLRQPLDVGQGDNSGLVERSVRDGGELFLKELKQGKELWSQLIRSDLRRHMAELAPPDSLESTDLEQLRSRLRDLEYDQRIAAAAFGQFPTFRLGITQRNESAAAQGELMKWPWSAAWQRWNLAAANDAIFQAGRLAQASWGDSRYTKDTLPEKFYFHRLGSKYALPAGFTNLVPINRHYGDLDHQRRSVLDDAAKTIKSLAPRFGREGETISLANLKTAPIPVQVIGRNLPAFAQVFLSSRGKRLSWIVNEPFEAWLADLSLPAEQRINKLQFATEYWQSSPPEGNLLLRGNLYSGPLNWNLDNTKRDLVRLALPGNEPQPAVLRVISSNKPTINVLLLVDCSDSMGIDVEFNREGQLFRGNLFDLVKDSVTGVIERFAEIHDSGEANVQMALLPFGLKQEDLSETMKKSLRPVGDKNYYAPRDSLKLDGNWLQMLSDNLSSLKPSDDTPLYNAIMLATEQAKPNEQTLVYVFTDGVNFLNEVKDRPLSKTSTDIGQEISTLANIRLNIFHFDYFERWINSSRSGPQPLEEKRTAWGKVFTQGIAELEALRKLGTRNYGYYRSNEGAKLMEESLATIPRARVKADSRGEQGQSFKSGWTTIGKSIAIPVESLPTELDITVQRPFEPAVSTEVQALGGESLVLSLDERGRISFPPFIDSGYTKETQGRRTGGNLRSRLFVRTLNDGIDNGQLGFRLYFANDDKNRFTRRPQFLLAEVSPSDTQRGLRMILADHRYVVGVSYPEANFSEFPWPDARRPARLRVWAADALPPQLTELRLTPNQAQPPIELGKATLRLTLGERLVADVGYSNAPNPEERVVILCPGFVSAVRTFDQNDFAERHEFELTETQQRDGVRIQYATIGDLEEAAKSNSLTQFEFDELVVERR